MHWLTHILSGMSTAILPTFIVSKSVKASCICFGSHSTTLLMCGLSCPDSYQPTASRAACVILYGSLMYGS